jgi:hypothetical protein
MCLCLLTSYPALRRALIPLPGFTYVSDASLLAPPTQSALTLHSTALCARRPMLPPLWASGQYGAERRLFCPPAAEAARVIREHDASTPISDFFLPRPIDLQHRPLQFPRLLCSPPTARFDPWLFRPEPPRPFYVIETTCERYAHHLLFIFCERRVWQALSESRSVYMPGSASPSAYIPPPSKIALRFRGTRSSSSRQGTTRRHLRVLGPTFLFASLRRPSPAQYPALHPYRRGPSRPSTSLRRMSPARTARVPIPSRAAPAPALSPTISSSNPGQSFVRPPRPSSRSRSQTRSGSHAPHPHSAPGPVHPLRK